MEEQIFALSVSFDLKAHIHVIKFRLKDNSCAKWNFNTKLSIFKSKQNSLFLLFAQSYASGSITDLHRNLAHISDRKNRIFGLFVSLFIIYSISNKRTLGRLEEYLIENRLNNIMYYLSDKWVDLSQVKNVKWHYTTTKLQELLNRSI